MNPANEPAFPQGHMEGPHIDPSGLTKRLNEAKLVAGEPVAEWKL